MPPDITQGPLDELIALARTRFGELSAAETKLLEAAPNGEFAVCGPNDDEEDPANDLSRAAEWGADREIRAVLIRWICVDHAARNRVDPKGIQAFGARIGGKLDLSSVSVPFGLSLRRCRLTEDSEFYSTDLPELDLQGSCVRSLRADGISVKGCAFLRNGFRAEGRVQLLGAQIGGNLACDNSVFTNPSGVALDATGINVEGSVFLQNGFRAEGEVRLLNARIGGNLNCGLGTFTNPLKEDVGGSGKALSADGAVVKGGVFLRHGFCAEGEVRLLGAQIQGDLTCTGATFTNPSKVALFADGISVRGSVFLRNGFCAEGAVQLLGAQIGGNLECDNSVFTNAPGVALTADHTKVEGSIFLRNGFRANGEVGLLDARIGGNLECDNSVFTNPSGVALSADGISVRGSVFFRNGFCAEGEVRLLNADIGGNLNCINANFDGRLNAQSSRTKGALSWESIVQPEQAELDLTNTRVGALIDDPLSWPAPGRLSLDGFVYERFSGSGPRCAKDRLEWLALQKGFAPQPYRQLAKVLSDNGHARDARYVLFQMERRRRQKEDRTWLARLWSGILRFTIGFGYYAWRSLLWLFGLTVLSTILFWSGYVAGSVAPSDKDVYERFKQSSRLPLHYERFYPPVYALENSFPLVKLGQAERWQPDPNPEWQCSSAKRLSRPLCWILSPWVLRGFRWGQICFGWFFTTMFVVGVTGIVRRE